MAETTAPKYHEMPPEMLAAAYRDLRNTLYSHATAARVGATGRCLARLELIEALAKQRGIDLASAHTSEVSLSA